MGVQHVKSKPNAKNWPKDDGIGDEHAYPSLRVQILLFFVPVYFLTSHVSVHFFTTAPSETQKISENRSYYN